MFVCACGSRYVIVYSLFFLIRQTRADLEKFSDILTLNLTLCLFWWKINLLRDDLSHLCTTFHMPLQLKTKLRTSMSSHFYFSSWSASFFIYFSQFFVCGWNHSQTILNATWHANDFLQVQLLRKFHFLFKLVAESIEIQIHSRLKKE